jgi:hypothetical protein
LALEAAASEESKAAALQVLLRDVSAASCRASSDSLWETWQCVHRAWFGEYSEPLPLTSDKLFAVAACFKHGSYRSWPSYMSKAKEAHVLAGHLWDLQLDLVARKLSGSVTRGLGVTRQSAPFDLCRAVAAVHAGKVALTGDSPLGWTNLLVVATYFIMREIEVANAKAEHVHLHPEELKVQLMLPVSKKDPRAVGCSRAWQCLCKSGGPIRVDCPYHAASAQLELLRATFGAPLPVGLPLFPTAGGRVVAKETIVLALEATVSGYGAPVVQPNGARLLGGHSFRVTGAQRLAALGVEVVKIMVLARWAGEAVLRYVRDAPLDTLPAEVKDLEEKRSLFKALERLQADMQGLDSRVESRHADLARLVKEASERSGHAPAKPYIAKGGNTRFKLHVAAIDGAEVLPSMWRTKCGVKFATWAFTRYGSLDGVPVDTLCTKCFGAKQSCSSAGPQVVPSSTSSSDASAGSSSV